MKKQNWKLASWSGGIGTSAEVPAITGSSPDHSRFNIPSVGTLDPLRGDSWECGCPDTRVTIKKKKNWKLAHNANEPDCLEWAKWGYKMELFIVKKYQRRWNVWPIFGYFFFFFDSKQCTDSYWLCELTWKLCIHVYDERRLMPGTTC